MADNWKLPAPGPVRGVENDWIAVGGGERLAVQLWIPDTDRLAPVVLEYIPYRKRDRYRAYGQYWGRRLAGFGIAYARVDTRGSGDSTGVLTDEYLPLEQEDAARAIAWLAAQPWCNGSVGMRGVSWGGFSALQAAALAPPALKAIMPMCASDRRYTDDAHYIGGALGLTDLKWAASFKLVMAAPPDPALSGEDWEALWRRRLEASPAIAAKWLRHQREDGYWRQGSVAENYGAIRCPVYLVGGLGDPYNAAIPRLLAGLSVPRKALIGPWRHGYPAPASPGPGLDWAHEEVRWWDHWLNGVETGIMDEPMLRVFMAEATEARTSGGELPGRWVAESAWPAPDARTRTLHLRPDGLADQAAESGTARIVGDRIVGLCAPEWVPFALAEVPGEQTPDDALSLAFDSAPLEDDLEILGAPSVAIRLTADRRVAHLAARLTEVSADGRSWLIAWGLINLTHRESHAEPAPLEPGAAYEIPLALSFTAHRFAKGSRLRLALSQSLWPLVWPAPEPASLEIELAGSRLVLPVRERPAAEAPFGIPLQAGVPPGAGGPAVEATREDGAIAFRARWPESVAEAPEIGTVLTGSGPNAELSITEGDPNSGLWRVSQSSGYRRGDWDCQLESRVELRSTASHFRVRERLVARKDGEVIFEREHKEAIPRDLM